MEKVIFGSIKEESNTMKESLRALRTNIQFSGDDVQVITITSTMPNEGKSTVVMDLGRILAEAGKKVLVVDTDMRKSVMVGRMEAKTTTGKEIFGLSHYLSGQKALEEVVYSTNIPRLFMVFAGPSVPNPTEILEKKYFDKLLEFGREHLDYVLLDCAPIGAAIDAAVVAKRSDGAIIVVAQGQANTRAVLNTKKQLEMTGVNILGAVMNKVKMKKNSYYGNYYGNYYGDYYGNE